jgi:two-component system sensor histidine kinase/response regulator
MVLLSDRICPEVNKRVEESMQEDAKKPIFDGAKILVAEDSPTQAEKLIHYLNTRCHEVTATRNGKQALAAALENRPDLIISDVVMPEMDGYTLCRQIKSSPSLRDVPVVLLTSLAKPQDIVKGLECGADSFIRKPYDEKYLLARVDYILTNQELRKTEHMHLGVQLHFGAQSHFITAEKQQILDLLISTYEGAVQINEELELKQRELQEANGALEARVSERTAELFRANQQLKTELAERERAEEEVKRLNEDLERRVVERTAQLAATNKELEAFSYSVSHDLRAPLRHISGFAQTLMEDCSSQLGPEAKHKLGRIQEGTRKMAHMIDDLLNLSRLDRHGLALKPTSLNSLVESVLQDLKAESAGREIEWRIGALPSCDCDPGLMQQVFTNLLSNAVKYTRRQKQAKIEVGQTTLSDQLVIYVRDNGAGFDTKYADKLFGAFQRLHRADEFEGTGVGPATVQRIIRKHGGRVWAEAEVDKGAMFCFTLGTASQAGRQTTHLHSTVMNSARPRGRGAAGRG